MNIDVHDLQVMADVTTKSFGLQILMGCAVFARKDRNSRNPKRARTVVSFQIPITRVKDLINITHQQRQGKLNNPLHQST